MVAAVEHRGGASVKLYIIILATFGIGAALAGAPEQMALSKPRAEVETLWHFASDAVFSFHAQIFYALVGSGILGMVGSWLWKWSHGDAKGFHHFTHRYAIGGGVAVPVWSDFFLTSEPSPRDIGAVVH